jgi:predicted transcriptional regulator
MYDFLDEQLYGRLVHSDRRVSNWCLCLSVSDLQRWRKGFNCYLPAYPFTMFNVTQYHVSSFKCEMPIVKNSSEDYSSRLKDYISTL